jgi:small G protein signaling modulator 3
MTIKSLGPLIGIIAAF